MGFKPASKPPWNIRQCAIYQKADFANRETTQILIRPPELTKPRLAEALNTSVSESQAFVSDWTALHSLILSSLDDGIRQYINYLDERVSGIFDTLILTGVTPEKLNYFDEPESVVRDMKNLQDYTDQAQRIATVVDLNLETLESLRLHAERVSNLGREVSSQFFVDVESAKREQRFAAKNVDAVIKRAHALSQQVR